METEIWQRLPDNLLYMILARLPVRVLVKMRTVCKEWKKLLSSRDAFQGLDSIWSLRSTPAFLVQIDWDFKNDVEFWVIEGSDLHSCKVPLFNCIALDSSKSILCCQEKGDDLALSIGIPGTSNWRQLPRPPMPYYHFSGMVFDTSTRRCTLFLGFSFIHGPLRQQMVLMCIYDSESNVWTEVIKMGPQHTCPFEKGIYCNGNFYWVAITLDSRFFIAAFNIAEGVWSEIPLPEGCRRIYPTNLFEYDGHLVVVDVKEADFVRMWMLNEAGEYEIWCEIRPTALSKEEFPEFPLVAVNSSGFILVIDCRLNMSIFNSEGKSIIDKMELPRHRTSELTTGRVFALAFESSNLWWP